MKIQLYSDLHIESMGYYTIPKQESDLIVLAGDIDVGTHGIEWAEELSRFHKKPVIYIAGNHEYYKRDYLKLTQSFRDYADQHDKLIYLEKDEVIIDGVRVLGATLWTNYCHELGVIERNRNMDVLNDALDDHRLIQYKGGFFTTQSAYTENQKAEKWLRQKLDEPFDGKTVVITHHSPSTKCGHREFGLNKFSSGFVSNLDNLVKKADFWFYGHTHCNEDMMIGKCRIISNQKGYPREKTAGEPYRLELLIEI
jgi:predicted phosphodiesterase